MSSNQQMMLNKFRKPQFANSGTQRVNEASVQTGHFVTKDQRMSVALEVKRSHFTFGTDKDDFRSKNEVEKMDQNWNIESRPHQNNAQHSSKQTHIQIGETNKFSAETSSKIDYTHKSPDLEKSQQALEAKQELRKAHFTFGTKTPIPDLYTTTNRAQHNLQPIDQVRQMEMRSSKNNQPSNNIVYGRDPVVYQSSSKDAMVEHNFQGQIKSQQMIKEQGLQLRKHNFHLGFDQDAYKPSLATESCQSEISGDAVRGLKNLSQLTAQPTLQGADIRKSHFELSYKKGGNDYTSISKMAQRGLQNMSSNQRNDIFQQREQVQRSIMDLRQSHFDLGHVQNQLEGNRNNILIDQVDYAHNPSTTDKEAIQNRMQKGNFTIGDEKNRSMKDVESSYKPAVMSTEAMSGGPSESSRQKHHVVSINLGFDRPVFVSESKQMYTEKVPQIRDSGLQQMIDRNKNPHFQLGDRSVSTDPTIMTSVAHQHFDYKGNAAEIRQTLDPEIKKDLRQHHFQMGSHPTDYRSSNLKSMNIYSQLPPTASSVISGVKASPAQADSLKKALQLATNNKGIAGMGPSSHSPSIQNNQTINKPTEFKTTNQMYSKWIQPAPSKDLTLSSLQ